MPSMPLTQPAWTFEERAAPSVRALGSSGASTPRCQNSADSLEGPWGDGLGSRPQESQEPGSPYTVGQTEGSGQRPGFSSKCVQYGEPILRTAQSDEHAKGSSQ